jgi:hypothetical protein
MSISARNPVHMVIGTLVMSALLTGMAALSAWPSYRATPEGTAVVKLSFSHGGERSCRPMTEAELAKLPPNMRRKEICDRKRPPVYVELDLDGERAYAALVPPGGLAGDGPSRVYERFVLPAGPHEVAIRMRDTSRAEGFDHETKRRITLAPDQSFAIDFNPAAGGFIFN